MAKASTRALTPFDIEVLRSMEEEDYYTAPEIIKRFSLLHPISHIEVVAKLFDISIRKVPRSLVTLRNYTYIRSAKHKGGSVKYQITSLGVAVRNSADM